MSAPDSHAASSSRNDEFVNPPEAGADVCHNPVAASTCRYWLAEREGMAVTLLDGCHGDPEGVAEAAKLHRRIFGKKGEGWIMVEIHDLPDLDPPINEDAAATCAHLVMEGTPHA